MEASKKSALELEAKQAEWAKKKWVWVPDEKEGCIPAHVIKEAGDQWTVKFDGGNEKVMHKDDLDQMNPPKFDKTPDMATLTHLNESSVLSNLKERYNTDQIYTYSGLFLVVINPWKRIPLYTDEIVAAYKGKKRREMAPHIFAVCDESYRDMLENKENQSLLITGESGAGKTENTKKVIQYLACVAGASGDGMASGTLEKQLVKTNPLMESFGNAKTIRNNNSSRFGKFIKIEFGNGGKIVGCNIDNYLLEKSRVVRHTEKERNFHIFYQLIEGTNAQQKSDLLLLDAQSYKYVAGNTKVDGVDNAAEFRDTIESMNVIGFSETDQNNIWQIISGIMFLGNLKFAGQKRGGDDSANLTEVGVADKVSHLFGIVSADFQRCLLKPRVKAGRDWVTAMVNEATAYHSADALAKTIYERLFKWIVSKINSALDVVSSTENFIGCLDIAGFEIFETNSFEQLCINLTNEKLQQFFNHHMFVLEQQEYIREGVEWTFIDFGLDLQPTIDLIEKPMGLMSILDEQCLFPKATDQSLVEKMHATHHGKSTKYLKVRMREDMFRLVHYAGDVEYETADWLEKNKDPINQNVALLLSKSKNALIAELFDDVVDPEKADAAGARRQKGAQFVTVSQRHRTQLTSLMTTLMSTKPHFVRCIIPNETKKPLALNAPLVLDQLRCNGVLEGIRIVRLGFPSRIPFAEFKQRYEILAIGAIPKGFMDGRVASEKLMKALNIDEKEYRIGSSKVFFKSGTIADLEEKRDVKLSSLSTGFQASARGYLARQQFRREHGKDDAIKMIQSNARVFINLYNWSWWKLYRQVKPLLSIHRQEEEEQKLKDKIKALQEQLEDETAKVTEMDKLRAELIKQRDLLDDQLDQERQSLEETIAELKAVDEQLKDLENLSNELEDQCGKAEEDALALEKQKQELKRKLDELNAKMADKSELLEKVEEAKRAKDGELDGLRIKWKAEKDALETQVAEEKERMTRQHSELKEDISRAKSELEKLKKSINTNQADNESMRDQLATSESARTKAEKEVTRTQAELDGLEDDIRTLKNNEEALSMAASTLERDVTSTKTKVSDLEASVVGLETRTRMAKQDVDELETSLQESESARIASETDSKKLELELETFSKDLRDAQNSKKKFEIQMNGANLALQQLEEAGKNVPGDSSILSALESEKIKNKALEERIAFILAQAEKAESEGKAKNDAYVKAQGKFDAIRDLFDDAE